MASIYALDGATSEDLTATGWRTGTRAAKLQVEKLYLKFSNSDMIFFIFWGDGGKQITAKLWSSYHKQQNKY